MSFYYDILSKIYRAPKNSGSLVALMYHEVLHDDVDIEAWTVVKRSDFEKQMVCLLKNHSIISLDEAVTLSNAETPLDKHYIVVTFDDGYSGNYDVVYPVIQKYNIPITIYVATKACQLDTIYWYDDVINALQDTKDYLVDIRNFNGKMYRIASRTVGEKKWTVIQALLQDLKKLKFEDRELAVSSILGQCGSKTGNRMLHHLNMNEIHTLSQSPLVTIGAHSHCHSMLPTIPREAALQSIIESKRLLEEWTSEPVVHFSYPNGDYDEAVLNMVQETGFKSGVTTRSDFWHCTDSRFEIPRLGIGRYDSLDKFSFRVARPDR